MAGPGFGDVQSGAMLAGGVAAALFQRERTGEGVIVDSSLLATAMWAMQPSIVAAQLTGVEVLPIAAHDSVGNPLTNNYRTSDDRYVGLGMLESDRYWPGFCKVCDVPEWLDDPRFADSARRAQHRELLTARLDELFAGRTLAEWKSVLGRQEGPWTVVQYPAEVARDPQAEANGYVQTVEYDQGRSLQLVSAPVQFGGSPGTLTPAPEHGAHTEDILQELGFDWAEINRLKAAGAII
jgi:crotonobetainyl-CoA:carnitine CoA-transferase CaiB-like acyl-CoA transferase